jgi:hypothetical protein
MKTLHENFAILKPESPFFRFFPEGRVPIKNVLQSTPVKLQGSDEKEAYLLDWTRCSTTQKNQISTEIARSFPRDAVSLMRQASEFFKWMDRGGELPIRVSSTVSATLAADLRLFV